MVRALLVLSFGLFGCDKLQGLSGADSGAAAASATASAAPVATPAETAPADPATATATTVATAAPNKTAATPTASAAPAGACENIAGTWTTRGACGPDTCIISQNGCSTNFKCSDGNASYTGTINGRSVTYAGLTALRKPGSCTGTLSTDNRTLSGTCQSGGVPCGFTATKR